MNVTKIGRTKPMAPPSKATVSLSRAPANSPGTDVRRAPRGWSISSGIASATSRSPIRRHCFWDKQRRVEGPSIGRKPFRVRYAMHVKNIQAEAEDLGKLLLDLSQMIKGVLEDFPIRGLGEAETWQVRDHHVIAVGECGNKSAIHVR